MADKKKKNGLIMVGVAIVALLFITSIASTDKKTGFGCSNSNQENSISPLQQDINTISSLKYKGYSHTLGNGDINRYQSISIDYSDDGEVLPFGYINLYTSEDCNKWLISRYDEHSTWGGGWYIDNKIAMSKSNGYEPNMFRTYNFCSKNNIEVSMVDVPLGDTAYIDLIYNNLK